MRSVNNNIVNVNNQLPRINSIKEAVQNGSYYIALPVGALSETSNIHICSGLASVTVKTRLQEKLFKYRRITVIAVISNACCDFSVIISEACNA